MARREGESIIRRILHAFGVGTGSVTLTMAVFLVLPLLQAITRPAKDMYAVREVSTTAEPPPPPPPEEEPEDEPEEEEAEPELQEEAPPLDLSQLELALNPGMAGDGWLDGDFAVKLNAIGGKGGGMDELFSVSELDQKPRVVYQASPAMSAKLRRKAPGTVKIVFVVDERGRVTNPVVQSSTDKVFERPALNAIKQWKFEPGKRNGQAVSFRMRVPITFPKG